MTEAGGSSKRRTVAGEQEWLTLPQVAVLYGVTKQRAWQMVQEGKIEATKVGTHWRVSRRWLDAQHAASGGVLAAADGRGLPGFLGTLAETDDDALWRRVRQEVQRALMETVGLLAEASILQELVEARIKRGDGELDGRRRKTG